MTVTRTFVTLTAAFLMLATQHHTTAEEATPMKQEPTTVAIKTTQGTIEVQLMPDIAPKATENFLTLSEQGYYDGLIFHRVIKDFMIQGGDPTGTGTGGSSIWNKNFEDEFSQSVNFDSPGILAMANAGPNTNGSQFFITTIATPWLNQRHTIFGKVTKGMDVVKKIETTKAGADSRPLEEQKILSIKVRKPTPSGS